MCQSALALPPLSSFLGGATRARRQERRTGDSARLPRCFLSVFSGIGLGDPAHHFPAAGRTRINLVWIGALITFLIELGMITRPVEISIFVLVG